MTLPLPCTLKGRKGRYQVASKLTDGGMSTVYLGKSSRGQAVVVKEASGPDLEQADERLRIEADILKALASPGHPRVVRYLDEGTNLGPFCLVEEKLEGDTLSERYRDKAADVDTATRYILQLLEALAYLHGRNVIHRDVKPNNIILDVNREVVLIDFGAAKKELHQFVGSGLHEERLRTSSRDRDPRCGTVPLETSREGREGPERTVLDRGLGKPEWHRDVARWRQDVSTDSRVQTPGAHRWRRRRPGVQAGERPVHDDRLQRWPTTQGVLSMARKIVENRGSTGAADTVIRSPRRRLGFASNVGKVRPVDEDSLLAMEVQTAYLSEPRTRLLLMVADGMGGHRRGDVASRTAVRAVARTILPLLTTPEDIPQGTYDQELRAAVDQANKAIFAEAARNPECAGMGTTLSLGIVDGRDLYVANVGDSRAYIINEREIFQVTRDHSLVQEMVDRGELSPEEARHHPRKNVITMALGVYEEVTPDIGCLTTEPGDMVLVCCDGLINHVEDEDIQRVVMGASDPQTACEILVALANKGGGTDNISVIVARTQPLSRTCSDV